MKRGLIRSLIFGTAAVAGVFLFAQTASAVSGRCDGCHTMHNSQDGTFIQTSNAQQFLLLDKCSGCHSRTDVTSPINPTTRAPAVTHTSDIDAASFAARASGASYLAGGSFRWVETVGPQYGHNVSELSTTVAETSLNWDPPGDSSSDYATGEVLSCNDRGDAGGLTGCHYGGGHHSNEGSVYDDGVNPSPNADDESVFVDGAGVGASYRFLSGSTYGGENADWEHTYSKYDHNIYAASANYSLTTAGSLTTVCVRCHGDFHGTYTDPVGAGTGTAAPWYRHPTDVDLGDQAGGVAAEHASYGSYDPTVPIADSSIATSGTVTGAGWYNYSYLDASADFNKVSCVSCHRAHGSEYSDALRWSYATMVAGNAGGAAGTGCFKCHSDKE